jgi:APA family basic amino acid/polyamine antiporter
LNKLKRKISLYGLTMIAAGSCIGSGIFRSPSETASYLPYDAWLLVAWVLGGFITMAGALSMAELGAMYPQAGGVYVYIRKAYGDAAAFLYGWVSLTVIITGSLAALALVFSSYVGSLFNLNETGKLILSLATIIILSGINVFGVKIGNVFSSIITTLKLVGILAVIVIGISMGHEAIDMNFAFSNFHSIKHPDMNFFSAFGLACVGIFFSYGGFQHASFLAGEVKEVNKTLPRAMILGTLIVIVVYIAINIAYLKLLPIEAIGASDKVASTAVSTVLNYGSVLIALLISVSILGTISIYCMSAPRIYYALAEDGLFFKKLAAVHPKYKTPANAIIAQCIIACIILFLWRTFEDVINYVIFVDYLFLALAVFGVVVLRRRCPNVERPYRTLGYPIVPLLFVAFSAFVLIVTFIEKPLTAWVCIACLSFGYIVYVLFKRNLKTRIN